MDTLSEVLRAIRLTGAVYFTIDGSSPWVVETPPGAVIAPHIGGGVEHVVNYHVITSGACWAGLVGEPAFRIEAGDIVAFPHGDPHVLSSEPGMRARADADVYQAASRQNVPLCVSLQGGGPAGAALVCGFLGCDARPFNPLLAALPRVIHLPAAREGTATARGLIDLALAESTAPRPGSAGVLSRLSEVLLVEIVRFLTRRSPSRPASRPGWFAGLEDAIVGPALNNLHQRPTTVWTLARLAKEVGTSRSVLAARFTRLVGMPPMQYLARWRMQMAATLLRTTPAGLAEIAERVGYGSEAALSRAFKRSLGVAPAYYRRDPAQDRQDRIGSGRSATRPGRPVILIRARSLYLQSRGDNPPEGERAMAKERRHAGERGTNLVRIATLIASTSVGATVTAAEVATPAPSAQAAAVPGRARARPGQGQRPARSPTRTGRISRRQARHGVHYRAYWVDEKKGRIYCLVDAPSADAAMAVHREAHGLVANQVQEVTGHSDQWAPAPGMKLYLDHHALGPGKVTAKDVAAAHRKDLAVQAKHKARFLNYWFDEAHRAR